MNAGIDSGKRNTRMALGLLGGAAVIGAVLLVYDRTREPPRRAPGEAEDRTAEVTPPSPSREEPSERAVGGGGAPALDATAPRFPREDQVGGPAIIGAQPAEAGAQPGDAGTVGAEPLGGGPAATDESDMPGPPVPRPITDAAPPRRTSGADAAAEATARAGGQEVGEEAGAVDAEGVAVEGAAVVEDARAEPTTTAAEAADAGAPTPGATPPAEEDAGGGVQVQTAEVGIAEVEIADVQFGISSGLVYDEAGTAYDPNVPYVVPTFGAPTVPIDGTGTPGGVPGGAFGQPGIGGITGIGGTGTDGLDGLAGGTGFGAGAAPTGGSVLGAPTTDLAGGTVPGGTIGAGGSFGTAPGSGVLGGTGGVGTGGFGTGGFGTGGVGTGGIGGVVGNPFGMFSPFFGAGGVWTFSDGTTPTSPSPSPPSEPTPGGETEPPTTFVADLLVPLGDGDPSAAWPAIAPRLRAGDLVVAFVPSPPEASIFLGFADRVATDARGATYVVSMPTPDAVRAAARDGLPATLGGLGVSTVAGVDDASLASISTLVRSSGKRFFVSMSTSTASTTPSLAEIGARADLVEIVPAAPDAASAVEVARPVVRAILAGGRPAIFVRIPSATAAASLTVAASTLASGLSVGVALPSPSTAPDLLANLR